ncbi:hypothetical protein CYMTET_28634 [Cymbomonas tetramitiformis]|uniref:Uncharacterized protein n=1 Tax=Cymbomonas tetramitiformis TaxID=36881 RepID=A0AAE0KVQ1_9CHLO|nr:hypothetical protein CYMTET_28634 [Cymbomonas tetramitiformis]
MTPVIAGYIEVSRESVESFATLFGKQLFLTLKDKQQGGDFDIASYLRSQFVFVAEKYSRNEEAIRSQHSPNLNLPAFSPLNAFGEISEKRSRARIAPSTRVVCDEAMVEELEFDVSNLRLKQTDSSESSKQTRQRAAVTRQDSAESNSSCETTKSEVVRQSATIMATLEKQYFDLEREHKSCVTKLQTALLANEVLNEANAKFKSELLEVCEEKAALSVGLEKLMFEIAEKESENSKLVEDLTRWKKNARYVTEQHRILLAKVNPCDLEEYSDCEEVVEEVVESD